MLGGTFENKLLLFQYLHHKWRFTCRRVRTVQSQRIDCQPFRTNSRTFSSFSKQLKSYRGTLFLRVFFVHLLYIKLVYSNGFLIWKTITSSLLRLTKQNSLYVQRVIMWHTFRVQFIWNPLCLEEKKLRQTLSYMRDSTL